MGKRILFIDDEVMILEAAKTILEDIGYTVHVFADSLEGERQALADDYDLILLDLRMPGKNGSEITKSILAKKPDARILVVTAYPQDVLARTALESGAMAVVRKPFEIAKILEYVER